MALGESALPELLDALRAGDGVDLIRDAVRLVMQELIELEAAEHVDKLPESVGVERIWEDQSRHFGSASRRCRARSVVPRRVLLA